MITMIACVDRNMGLGIDNKLLYKFSGDLANFKSLTTGQLCLMGSRTFESILMMNGESLPNRHSIVLTTSRCNLASDRVSYYSNLNVVLDSYKDSDLFVIGGASIYEQMMKHADRLVITHVHDESEADTYFPRINSHIWKISKILVSSNKYNIVEYERKKEF